MNVILRYIQNISKEKALVFLFFLGSIIPAFNYVADRIGIQWFYLSVVLLFSSLYLIYSKKINFTFLTANDKFAKYVFISYSIFILTSIYSVFSAKNVTESLVVLSHYITIYLIFFVTISLSKKINNFKGFILTLLYLFLVVEIIFVLIPIIEDIEVNSLLMRSNRYVGLMSNINITAFSLLYKLPVIFYFLEKSKNNFNLILNFFIFFSVIFCVLILGSRASFIALAFIFFFRIIFYILYYKRRFKKQILGLTIVITLAALLNLKFSSSSNFLDRAAKISLVNNDSSINQRINYYKSSVEIFKENPFFGIGVGNWKFESINKNRFNITGYIVPFVAHNDFLQILNENGLFGFLSYGLIFLFVAFIILKNTKSLLYIYIGLFFGVYFIDSMLNFPLVRPVSQLHFILFLTLFFNLNEHGAETK